MDDYIAIQRCILLAKSSGGWVHPNPKVGCIIVHNHKVIGEGRHHKSGGHHAEVMALSSVEEKDKNLIKYSTLYVNLEPCCHFGKTPPCTDLIISNGIKNVVIGVSDPNPKVSGKGIKCLKKAGVNVKVGIYEIECIELNKRFFQSIQKGLPYVVIKWAESSDGYIDKSRNSLNSKPIKISSPSMQPIVHSWRSKEQAILIGIKTFLTDRPILNVRLSSGPDPIKIIWISKLIKKNKLDLENAFKEGWIIWGPNAHESANDALLRHLKESGLRSILVEGGAETIKYFFKASIWNECRIIKNEKKLGNGVAAPLIPESHSPQKVYSIDKNKVSIYFNPK